MVLNNKWNEKIFLLLVEYDCGTKMNENISGAFHSSFQFTHFFAIGSRNKIKSLFNIIKRLLLSKMNGKKYKKI